MKGKAKKGKPNPVKKAKSKPETKSKPKPKTSPQPKPKAKSKPQIKSQPKLQPKPPLQSKSQPQIESQPKLQPKPPLQSKSQPQPKPQPKPQSKPPLQSKPQPLPRHVFTSSPVKASLPKGKVRIGIIIGSESDRYVMDDSIRTLEDLGLRYDLTISSAHRNPEQTRNYAREAARRGLHIIIAGAGGAAHLAGVLAAETTLPVIAVPMDSSPLHGLDSFLSTFQMPSGVPVATMGIGRSGAKNAAILAAEILALNDSDLEKRLREFKRKIAEGRRLAGEPTRPEPQPVGPRRP